MVLAQTPEKDRKQYQRQYRKDLEAIANHIMETPDKRIPDNVRQAMDTPEWPKWQEAINKEINALYRTDSLEKVTVLPTGVKAIQCRWVFKIKPMNAQEPEIYIEGKTGCKRCHSKVWSRLLRHFRSSSKDDESKNTSSTSSQEQFKTHKAGRF